MRRRTFVGFFTVVALLVVGAVFFLGLSRLVPPSPAQLALKHINPPSSWADPDCSRLQRTISTAVRESGSKTIMSTDFLSADEVAVYRVVLHQRNSDPRTSLNVSDRTFPLDAVSPRSSISNCECSRGLEVQSLVSASHSIHALTLAVLPERNIRLVDADTQLTIIQHDDPHNGMARGKSVEKAVNDAFASGLLSMSEIAFDRDHRQALVSYSFVCGSLCGSGGTWLLEKVDGVWRRTDRVCGGWVS
jgi:hypothetical protein